MIRVFECINNLYNKFWTIEILENTDLTLLYNFRIKTTYGKIGTKGQISYKEYWSKEDAYINATKLIKSKTKKGYVENR